MLAAAPPPFPGDRPKSHHRRPLQPKNIMSLSQQPKRRVEISASNKENVPPVPPIHSSAPVKKGSSDPPSEKEESIDPSLADELNAIRERLERLRSDGARNEEVLRERSELLDSEMKEVIKRGEAQKQLELELDRLYRLNEINQACLMTSRFRSLRDKEEEKKMKLNKAYIYIQGRESLNSEASLN